MTVYAIIEPSWHLPEPDRWECPLTLAYSDQDILKEYWDSWSALMRQRKGQDGVRLYTDADITPENCIDDWVVINWAWKLGSTKNNA